MCGSSAQYLKQVVPRDVGFVPDGDERRESDIQPLRPVKDRQAEGAALTRHGHRTRRWKHRRERRVETAGGVRVEHAEAVRPDHSNARPSNLIDQLELACAPGLVRFAEPGADNDDCPDMLLNAVVDHSGHLPGGNAHERKIDGVGNLCHARIRRYAVDARRRWMHHEKLSRVAGRDQVVQQLRADLAPLAAGADDRHRSRLEERLDGCGRRCPGARRGAGFMLGRFFEGKRDAKDAGIELLAQHEARIQKHTHHAVVGRKHVRVKFVETLAPAAVRKRLEQRRADSFALRHVGDRKGHFRAIGLRAIADPTCHCHEAGVRLRNENGVIGARGEQPRDLHINSGDPEESEIETVV